MCTSLRQTKIVFTIGPTTSDEAVLTRMIENGVDVCRFNMAHAQHDWFRDTIALVNSCCRKVGRRIALMMDVKGPEIRTRDVPDPIDLLLDELVEFSYQPLDGGLAYTRNIASGVHEIGVNYPGFVADLTVGTTVLVDSGLIRLITEELTEESVLCRVITPGTLGSRRHINLPGVKVKLPALTEKDIADVRVGIEQGIDFFALSFVRESSDLDQLRQLLRDHGSGAHVIAKIEDESGVAHLDQIVQASDGVMVARGDLGIEVPFEQLPIFQRRAVDTCLSLAKPVIIATHMLESMIHSPVPTRAEITDISNSVREQADCVMLSGETTIGKYPERCIDVLNRVIMSVQRAQPGVRNDRLVLKTGKEKMLRAAVDLSEQMSGAGIVVFTRSGDLARLLSAQRPKASPIFAFTDDENVFKRMLMLWGVEPFLMELDEDPEQTIVNAFDYLKRSEWAIAGDPMIVITNVLGKGAKIIDSLQVREIE
ncbi:MAG: pyruvate kinase [Planctomycetaceae bacterium]|nr:pyruvate kinase [Planctomycetales bacterium]MCB9921519.1 pyruvate kinase [Planctomycetaceae bacterium]